MPHAVMTSELGDMIFSHAEIGMAFVSRDGVFLRANIAMCRMLGYAESELIGRSFRQITHPDDLAGDESMVQAVLAGKIPGYAMLKRYITKDEQVRWARLSVLSVPGQSDEVAFMFSQISLVRPSPPDVAVAARPRFDKMVARWWPVILPVLSALGTGLLFGIIKIFEAGARAAGGGAP